MHVTFEPLNIFQQVIAFWKAEKQGYNILKMWANLKKLPGPPPYPIGDEIALANKMKKILI